MGDAEASETEPLMPLISFREGSGPTFIVTSPEEVILREGPGRKSTPTGQVLRPGDVFIVSNIVTINPHDGTITPLKYRQASETCYLCVSRGRGWLSDRHHGTHEYVVEYHEPERTGSSRLGHQLRNFFLGMHYEYAIMMVIMVNAATIGLEINSPTALAYDKWLVVNSIFAAIYVTELLLKLSAFGLAEFLRSNWNVFDLLVTITTFAGDCYTVSRYVHHPHHNHNDAGVVAVVPVIRLLRILRAANLFAQLRLLVQAFMGSVASLSWIALFTLLWFYICACLCTVFIGRSHWLGNDIRGAGKLRAQFDTIGMSMYTLFEVMTLEGWTDVVRPLVGSRPLLVLFFLFFAFITAFFLMNLVTGVVVDRTMEAKASMEEADGDLEEGSASRIISLYGTLQSLNNGEDRVSKSSLASWSGEPEVRRILAELEWKESLERNWYLLEADSAGEVSLKELLRVWTSSQSPLNRALFLKSQVQTARRMHAVLERLEQRLQAQERMPSASS